MTKVIINFGRKPIQKNEEILNPCIYVLLLLLLCVCVSDKYSLHNGFE